MQQAIRQVIYGHMIWNQGLKKKIADAAWLDTDAPRASWIGRFFINLQLWLLIILQPLALLYILHNFILKFTKEYLEQKITSKKTKNFLYDQTSVWSNDSVGIHQETEQPVIFFTLMHFVVLLFSEAVECCLKIWAAWACICLLCSCKSCSVM